MQALQHQLRELLRCDCCSGSNTIALGTAGARDCVVITWTDTWHETQRAPAGRSLRSVWACSRSHTLGPF